LSALSTMRYKNGHFKHDVQYDINASSNIARKSPFSTPQRPVLTL